MIEFKLTEINALMKECIEQEFKADVMSDSQSLMLSCTGLTYQILFHNFKDGMRKIKVIFLELLKKKMKSLDAEYDDEIDFFLDILEDFIDKDYKLSESLEISKKNVKYYVSPRFYDSLLDIAEPEIRAINAIHSRLKVSRKEVQEIIVKKMIERENYLRELDGKINANKPEEQEESESQEPSFAGDAQEDESKYGMNSEDGEYGDEGEQGYDGEGDEEDNYDDGASNQSPYDDQYDNGGEGDDDQHDSNINERREDEQGGDSEGPEFDERNSE